MGGVGAASLPEERDRCHKEIRGDVPHLKNSKSVRKYEGWKFNFGNAAVTFDTAQL
jgi:hypothetical protein